MTVWGGGGGEPEEGRYSVNFLVHCPRARIHTHTHASHTAVNCNGLTARSCYCDQCAGNTVLGCCLYRDQPIQNTTGQGDTPLGFSNTVIPGTDTTAEGGNPSPNPCVAVPLIPTNAVNLVHVAVSYELLRVTYWQENCFFS